MDYSSALNYIHSFEDPYPAALRDHGKQTWGLAKVSALLEKLGNPHLHYPVIHVAGTKGKGSTCALIAQGLIESGLKTGLYISPHLEDWRERIQIDRTEIAKDELARLVTDFESLVGKPSDVSEFEITTALAFLHFMREGCDAAVIEVGLGGRLDATNVVKPLVSVITNISLDHMQLLGNTLSEIAGEKVAIIKDSVPVVSAPQIDEVLAVIETRARTTGSALTLVGHDIQVEIVNASLEGSTLNIGKSGAMSQVKLKLPGIFQYENAAVAFAALRVAQQSGLPIKDESIIAGLGHAEWPGRMEVISGQPLIVIDSAHTPYSVKELVKSLELTADASNWTFVFGCMADKDIRGMLEIIMPVASKLVLTQAKNERAASPDNLLEIALGLVSEKDITTRKFQLSLTPSVDAAVEVAASFEADSGLTCYLGSLSVAGAARTILRSHELQVSN